jgi:thioredoxin reductase
VQHALLVRQWSEDVAFFVHNVQLGSDEMRQLTARGIQTVQGTVARLVVAADRLAGVELADGAFISRAAIFVRPVNVPHDDGLVASLGCEVDETGFVKTDGTGRTSASGVWAAGNVVDPRLQVITSAGAGSAAAIAINADLVQADLREALDGPTSQSAHVAASAKAAATALSA